MSGGNQTPRQQMIGLMYLVLLAMLAMNASKDLLNAFVYLEDGIDVTTDNFNSGNKSVYDKITSAAALGSKLAIDTKNNSDEVFKESNKLYQLLDQYKVDIIELGGGVDEETKIPLGKDNQDVGAEYILTGGKGAELKEELRKYKELLIQKIDKRDTAMISSINRLLGTPDHTDYENNTVAWESNISEYLPLAAVTANLTNIQSYIRNAESQLINYMFEEINLDTYKVNKIMATSIAENSYVLQGDNYSANIFLAAADTTQEPIVIVGDYDTSHYRTTGQIKFISTTDTLPVGSGIGEYKIQTESTGNHAWGGIMKVPHPNPKRKGQFLTYPFVNNYTVAAPSAVISSDQLNIMYKGLKNEISISAAGLKADQVSVSAQNCKVTNRQNGKYYFEPTKAGRIKITVSTKVNGVNKTLSSQEWKSKLLPKPNVVVSGVKNGRISSKALATILEQFGAKAKYDPAFPISTQPNIIHAEMRMNDKGNINKLSITKKGKINHSTAQTIKRLRRNTTIELTLKARGLDNITHTITKTITIK